MRLEYAKATFAVVWMLAMVAVGFTAQVTSVAGMAVLAGLAVLLPLVMWRVWTVPSQSMSESIRSITR